MWHPELVGKPGYPKTEEDWKRRSEFGRAHAQRMIAEGKFGRQGVPDGWAGRKTELAEVRAKAAADAPVVIKYMIENEMLDLPPDMPEIPADDAGMAKAALEAAMKTVLDPSTTVRDRNSAIRTVLDFTKQKPAAKTELGLAKAEDWLAAIASEATKPKE